MYFPLLSSLFELFFFAACILSCDNRKNVSYFYILIHCILAATALFPLLRISFPWQIKCIGSHVCSFFILIVLLDHVVLQCVCSFWLENDAGDQCAGNLATNTEAEKHERFLLKLWREKNDKKISEWLKSNLQVGRRRTSECCTNSIQSFQWRKLTSDTSGNNFCDAPIFVCTAFLPQRFPPSTTMNVSNWNSMIEHKCQFKSEQLSIENLRWQIKQSLDWIDLSNHCICLPKTLSDFNMSVNKHENIWT